MRRGVNWLQCGRGIAAAERCGGRRRTRPTLCFNVAAALLPRKVAIRPKSVAMHSGFNVAAALLPRKGKVSKREQARINSFNVAAALLPRKVRRNDLRRA